jgi:hypothetical protein
MKGFFIDGELVEADSLNDQTNKISDFEPINPITNF